MELDPADSHVIRTQVDVVSRRLTYLVSSYPANLYIITLLFIDN